MDQEGQLGKNLVKFQHNHLQNRPILLLSAYRCLFCRWQRHRRPFLLTRLRQPPPRSRQAPVVRPPPRPRPLPVPAAPPPRRRRPRSSISSSTTSTVSGAFSSVLGSTVMTRRRRIAFAAVIADIADLSVFISASTGTFALPTLSPELKRRLRSRRVQIIVIQAEKSRTLIRRLSAAQCRTSTQRQFAKRAPTSLWKLLRIPRFFQIATRDFFVVIGFYSYLRVLWPRQNCNAMKDNAAIDDSVIDHYRSKFDWAGGKGLRRLRCSAHHNEQSWIIFEKCMWQTAPRISEKTYEDGMLFFKKLSSAWLFNWPPCKHFTCGGCGMTLNILKSRPSSPQDLRLSGRGPGTSRDLHFVWRNEGLRLDLLRF